MNEIPPPGATLTEVLPGEPDDLDDLATLLESYVDGAVTAARGLRSMDSGSWVGEAAEAFWSSVAEVLKRLDEAAAAFQEAVFALRAYTTVLRISQAEVGRALALIEDADAQSREWAAKNADALVQNVTAPYTGVIAPLSPADPGQALRHRARLLITEAKDRVSSAGRRAAEQLDAAAEHAPDKPGFLSRSWHVVSEVAGGAVESVTDMATFTFKLSPVYPVIDPEGYVDNGVGLVKGFAYAVAHPVEFAKAVVDWDMWVQSPGRAIGHLVPTVALTIASAGAGTAGKGTEVAGAVRGVDEASKVASGVTRTRFTERLDAGLATPKVADPKLQNYVENLYKGTSNPARVGTGTTADAVRNELLTGRPTGGTFHSIKAQETIRGLERWLRRNLDAPYLDRLVARSLLEDLRDALGGAP